jgi:hypothetical protein
VVGDRVSVPGLGRAVAGVVTVVVGTGAVVAGPPVAGPVTETVGPPGAVADGDVAVGLPLAFRL